MYNLNNHVNQLWFLAEQGICCAKYQTTNIDIAEKIE
jgi:hypothetical protein